MMIWNVYIFASILLLSLWGRAQQDEEIGKPRVISEAQNSASLASESYGYYAHGSLQRAFIFPNEGDGFIKIMRTKERQYGTFTLYAVISKVATLIKSVFPESERLQLGDISGLRGGKISGHASHQNGLDVDIAYFRKDRREMDPNRGESFDETFVTSKGVSRNFDLQRNWALFQLLIQTGQVGRIFIDQKIKRAVCAYVKSQGLTHVAFETLRRLRPLAFHNDHFHVRVLCPVASSECVEQEDPPPETGC